MSNPFPGFLDSSLHPYFLAFSGLSLITSTFVICSYISLRKQIQHPSGVQLWRSIFDTIFAGSIIALFFLHDPADNPSYCNILGPIFQFSLLGSQCWYFVLSFDLLFSLFNPFSDLGSNVKFYHLFVWAASIASVVAIVIYGDFAWRPAFQLCWIRVSQSSTDSPNVLSWGTLFIPTLAFLLFGILVTLIAFNRIYHGIPETLKLRNSVLKNVFITNFLFTIYWVVAGTLYVILYTQETGPLGESETFFGAFAVVIGGLGLVDALVWVLTQGFPCRACRKERVDLQPINYALRREIIHNTAKGICANIDRVLEYPKLPRPPEPGSKYYPRALRPSKNSQGAFTFRVFNEHQKSSVPFFDYAPRVFQLLRRIFGVQDTEYKLSFEQTLQTDFENKMRERFTEGKSGSFFYFTPDGKYLVKTMYPGEVRTLLNMLPAYTYHCFKNRNTLLVKYFGLHRLRMYGEEVFFVVMESVFLTDLVVHERYDIKGSTYGRYSKQFHLNRNGHIKEVLKDLDVHKRFMIDKDRKIQLIDQVKIDVTFLTQQKIMDYSLLVGVRYVRQYRQVPGLGRASVASRASVARQASQGSRPSLDVSVRGSLNPNDPAASTTESEPEAKMPREREDSKEPLLPEGDDGSISYPKLDRLMSPSRRNNSDDYYFHQHEGGVKADVIDGPGVYYFGIIDILQYYNIRKRLEHFFKSYILCRPSKKISCVNPTAYGLRFMTKIEDVTQCSEGELEDYMDFHVLTGTSGDTAADGVIDLEPFVDA